VHTDATRRVRPARDLIHADTAAFVLGSLRPLPPGTTMVSSAGAAPRVVDGLKTIPESDLKGLPVTPMITTS